MRDHSALQRRPSRPGRWWRPFEAVAEVFGAGEPNVPRQLAERLLRTGYLTSSSCCRTESISSAGNERPYAAVTMFVSVSTVLVSMAVASSR